MPITSQLHLPEPGDRIRIACQFKGHWWPVLWARVGKDGSVYVGTHFDAPSGGSIQFNTSGDKTSRFSYTAGRELGADSFSSGSRVSFKVDGEIHYGNERVQGQPLLGLARKTQLGVVMPAHPDAYPPPLKKNKNDYDVGILGYPVAEDRPMLAYVFVSPFQANGTVTLEKMDSMSFQSTLFFAFRKLRRTPDLLLEVVVGNGPTGPWPPTPGVVFLAKSAA